MIREDYTDDKFFECAAATGARYVISCDRHLLSLRKYTGVRILPVREFLKLGF